MAGFHPIYGKAALGLIATIRTKDKNIPITLFYSEGAINNALHGAITGVLNANLVPLLPEHYNHNGRIQFVKAKTRLYDLSPYQKTMYLDVDMAWLPRKTASEAMDSLSGVPFAMQSEGYFDAVNNVLKSTGFYHFWADHYDIIEEYPAVKEKGRLNMLRSEMIYFEKSTETKKLFALVKKIYDSPKTRTVAIGGAVPDEYAFNIATSTLGIYPHQENFDPIFWDFKRGAMKEQPQPLSTIMSTKWAYSVGGKVTSDQQKDIYNNQIKAALNAAKLQNLVFTLRDKNEFPILNRQKI